MTHGTTSTPARPPRDRRRILDVLVIGGGAAGLSAALTLARARRDVIVVDAGSPRNAPAEGVHGFLTRDGIPPLELTRLGRAEVESYGGEVLPGIATSARIVRNADHADEGHDGAAARFAVSVTTPDGRVDELRARRLIVATGLTDQLPPVTGLAERWGRDVVHCPYCHGWEIRDRAIGVLATSALATQQALLFRQWSSDVTLFLHEGPEPSDDQWDALAARGIAVVTGPVIGLRVDDDRLTGVTLATGRTLPIDALAVGAPVRANADVLADLGIVAEPPAVGIGMTVPNDPLTGATAVPGVWVAGNVGDLKMQVVTAAAAGVLAGAGVNADLIAEETAAAVLARRGPLDRVPFSPDPTGRPPFGARAEAQNTTALLGDRRHGVNA